MADLDYRHAQNDTENRFLDLTKLARIRHTDASTDFDVLRSKTQAVDRLVAYSTEYLAHEAHMTGTETTRSLTTGLQANFEVVGRILDRHVGTGEQTCDKRRAVLEKAETFVESSNFYRGESAYYTDSSLIFGVEDQTGAKGKDIADNLNETEARRALPRYRLDRELGLRRQRPDYTGTLDRDFTADEAVRLVEALDELHQDIRERVEARDQFASDGVRDAVPDYPTAGETDMLERQIAERDPDLAELWPQTALGRTDAFHETLRTRERAIIADDDFLDSSPEPSLPEPEYTSSTGRPKRARHDAAEDSKSSDDRPAKTRRLSRSLQRPQVARDDQADSSTASESPGPRSPSHHPVDEPNQTLTNESRHRAAALEAQTAEERSASSGHGLEALQRTTSLEPATYDDRHDEHERSSRSRSSGIEL